MVLSVARGQACLGRRGRVGGGRVLVQTENKGGVVARNQPKNYGLSPLGGDVVVRASSKVHTGVSPGCLG